MAVDLGTILSPNRQSLLLAADAIIRLEHQLGRDRVRRILYEHLQSVMVWRVYPWAHVLAAGLLLGVPAFIIAVAIPDAGICIAIAMMIPLALAIGLFSLWRKTVIRIVWAGQQYDFAGIMRPATAERFIRRLHEAVGHARAAAMKITAERAAANEAIIPLEEVIVHTATIADPGAAAMTPPPVPEAEVQLSDADLIDDPGSPPPAQA